MQSLHQDNPAQDPSGRDPAGQGPGAADENLPEDFENPASLSELRGPARGMQSGARQAIEIAKGEIAYLGVSLPRGMGGPHAPDPQRFQSDTITEYDLRLMQKIALAWELDEALLIEGGSGLGKTRTIERMCSQLGWDCYYANCHDFDPEILIGAKTVREDTRSGFGWKDGIVIQALRGAGEAPDARPRVLLLDEFNFMRGETRGRLHEILDAVLTGRNRVVLLENDGEILQVSPGLKIVALQNPPGNRFEDREILDEAQLTRFTYQKEPTSMPERLMLDRALGGIGKGDAIRLDESEFMHPRARLTRADISAIPGIETVLKKYVEFARTIEHMARKTELAEDQPQPVYFSFQRDYDRVLKFVARHYDGDLNGTFRKALGYFYANKFESPLDRERISEMIEHVGYFPPVPDARLSLGDFEAANQDRLHENRDLLQQIMFLNGKGVTDEVTAASLAGLDSPQAFALRERLLAEGVDKNQIAAGLAGVKSEAAYEMRERLIRQGAQPRAVLQSLSGDDSERAWEMRRELAPQLKKPYQILESIAGLESDAAWELRDSFAGRGFWGALKNWRRAPRDAREAVAASLAGLESERAWEMRGWMTERGLPLSQLTASVAGLGSERSWDIRERAYQDNVSKEIIARSMIGLDDAKSWEIRARFEKNDLPIHLLQSLAGLHSDAARSKRESIMEDGMLDGAVAASLSGDWLAVAIREARARGGGETRE